MPATGVPTGVFRVSFHRRMESCPEVATDGVVKAGESHRRSPGSAPGVEVTTKKAPENPSVTVVAAGRFPAAEASASRRAGAAPGPLRGRSGATAWHLYDVIVRELRDHFLGRAEHRSETLSRHRTSTPEKIVTLLRIEASGAEVGITLPCRCKLFHKKGDGYVERGVGTLYVKSLNGRHQLLLRADTSLGEACPSSCSLPSSGCPDEVLAFLVTGRD